MRDCDLNLFKIFYYVAKHKSFTKAAEILYITQPAISQSIKKLEEHLNAKLFERKNKEIELTKAGEIVYHYSEQLNSLVKSSTNLVKKLEKINSSEIKIGVPTHNSYYFIGENISKLCKKYKNIKIKVLDGNMYEMMRLLEKRDIDVLIGANLTSESKTIRIDNINNIDSCFVASQDFKIGKSELNFNELNKYPLILPTSDTSNRKMLDFLAKKYYIDKLNSIVDCNSSTICKKLVMNNIGIAWMKRDIIQDDLNSKKMREIKVIVDRIQIPFSIAYNIDFLTEQVRYFVNLYKKN